MTEPQSDRAPENADVLQIKAEHKRDMVRLDYAHDEQILAGLPFAARMYFDQVLFDRMNAMADRMAASKGMPAHIRGDAIMGLYCIERGWSWGMSPLAVAMGTFKIGEQIGHYGRTIIAAINGSGRLHGSLQFSHFEDKPGKTWAAVTANFREMESRTKKDEHGNAAKYLVPNYTRADEDGLGVIITGHIKGEDNPRQLRFFLKQAWPRNSTLWATDPATQICYTGARRFGSLYVPDIVAGARMEDDFEPPMRNITPAEQQAEAAAQPQRSALSILAAANAPREPIPETAPGRPSVAEAAKAGMPHQAPEPSGAHEMMSEAATASALAAREAMQPRAGPPTPRQQSTVDTLQAPLDEPARRTRRTSEQITLDMIDRIRAATTTEQIEDEQALSEYGRRSVPEKAQIDEAAEQRARELQERPPEPAGGIPQAEPGKAATPAPGGDVEHDPETGEILAPLAWLTENTYYLTDTRGDVLVRDLTARGFLDELERRIADSVTEGVARAWKVRNQTALENLIRFEKDTALSAQAVKLRP